MRVAKISEFKAHLAKYLRLAREGEEVSILDRGTPIARLVGLNHKSPLSIRPPQGKAENLAKLESGFSGTLDFDITKLLIEERSRE